MLGVTEIGFNSLYISFMIVYVWMILHQHACGLKIKSQSVTVEKKKISHERNPHIWGLTLERKVNFKFNQKSLLRLTAKCINICRRQQTQIPEREKEKNTSNDKIVYSLDSVQIVSKNKEA